MTIGHSRFALWLAWSGLTQAAAGSVIGCSAVFVGYLVRGQRAPGLSVAQAIESVTARPRADGEYWSQGPIRTEEWLHTQTVTTPTAAQESGQ